ncbi:myb-like transcription factor family protein [Striga hermonthica]|uniref:Myb-like transcription factor family protein n=1 Tax=Striga hermonthica TaxID=68872 RepID=A0A9N7N830_STRHE|nr:myb-like transcription factor family protein [Striga hermonthica]
MTRRCSHCSHNGHNSRTCPNRGVKLFGVRLTDGSIRKSASMGNLTHYMGGGGGGGSGSTTPQNGVAHESPGDTPDHPSAGSGAADGYASEDFVAGSSSSRERKKGVPWTEEEHRLFLVGLQKLGKGDWRGIARNYVISRTPTQVASHAQKYFIRQSNVSRRKRRSSLFDIVADEPLDASSAAMSRDFFPANSQQADAQSSTPPVPPPPLVPPMEEECESMESANSNDGEIVIPAPEGPTYPYPVVYPAYVGPVFPMSVQFWPTGFNPEPIKEEAHQVVKPTAVHTKSPINVDELVGMSKLSLGESLGDGGPNTLSLKLVEGSSTRPSAFHASNNPPSDSSGMKSSHSPIHAV